MSEGGSELAIVGVALRFPGANDLDELWENLRAGIESITRMSREQVLAAGANPALVDDPRYVRAHGCISHIDLFDAALFGFTPRDAEVIDPQQRLFLECAWEALEHAAIDPSSRDAVIGVFAGASRSTYAINNLGSLAIDDSSRAMQLMVGNERDFLPAQVSYQLDLTGPSINVQTACSTSLVAVHLACQSLLAGECDVALAGAASIPVPQEIGYLFSEGMILAPDGHCRPFDARARGTVPGSGVGIVVLERLDDALAKGRQILGVIKGSAINNDGRDRVGFTAPGIQGQCAVITEALAVAGTPADSIGYVEAHGTATALGDPNEIAALTQAFRVDTKRKGFCAIGSIKSNFGHLDTVAGVAGLMKAMLSLSRGELPPSLHFERPNPNIDFGNSPFYVNDRLRTWPSDLDHPRRAGVSSFGIGGTNAHVILEEPPEPEPSGPSREVQVLTLSGRDPRGARRHDRSSRCLRSRVSPSARSPTLRSRSRWVAVVSCIAARSCAAATPRPSKRCAAAIRTSSARCCRMHAIDRSRFCFRGRGRSTSTWRGACLARRSFATRSNSAAKALLGTSMSISRR